MVLFNFFMLSLVVSLSQLFNCYKLDRIEEKSCTASIENLNLGLRVIFSERPLYKLRSEHENWIIMQNFQIFTQAFKTFCFKMSL